MTPRHRQSHNRTAAAGSLGAARGSSYMPDTCPPAELRAARASGGSVRVREMGERPIRSRADANTEPHARARYARACAPAFQA